MNLVLASTEVTGQVPILTCLLNAGSESNCKCTKNGKTGIEIKGYEVVLCLFRLPPKELFCHSKTGTVAVVLQLIASNYGTSTPD